MTVVTTICSRSHGLAYTDTYAAHCTSASTERTTHNHLKYLWTSVASFCTDITAARLLLALSLAVVADITVYSPLEHTVKRGYESGLGYDREYRFFPPHPP